MVLCIAPIQGLAQTPITPQEMAEKMGMAINMGNTLEAPDFEGNWAKAAYENNIEKFEKCGRESQKDSKENPKIFCLKSLTSPQQI